MNVRLVTSPPMMVDAGVVAMTLSPDDSHLVAIVTGQHRSRLYLSVYTVGLERRRCEELTSGLWQDAALDHT